MILKKLIKNKINLKTKQKFVGIIGSNPSKGARSPFLWNKAFSKLKIKMKMYPLDVKDKNLKSVIKTLKEDSYFCASAVTIPYKEKVIKYLNVLDKAAAEIGSVNLIVRQNKKLKGYNTDSLGCRNTLDKINKKIKNILIIGCGGAGKACIISTKNKFTKAKIFIFNRNLLKLKKFNKRIRENKKNIKIVKSRLELKKLKRLDLIINTTSMGFEEDLKSINSNLKYFSPISYEQIQTNKLKTVKELNGTMLKNIMQTIDFLRKNSKALIFDIIYKPSQTLLMYIAEKLGLKSVNGLEMNFMQAVEAFKIVNKNIKLNKIIKAMK